jgi:hypothetical protein
MASSQYLCDASSLGTPEKLKVGDIQASELANLMSDSPRFEYAPDIIRDIREHTKSDTYIYEEPGLSKLNKCLELPYISSNAQWTLNGTSVKQNFFDLEFASVLISTIEPIEITTFVSVVCPEISDSIDSSGCFNCEDGAFLKISAWSSCASGSASVLINGTHAAPASIQLSQTKEIYEVKFWPSASSELLEICLEANKRSCVRKLFTFDKPDILDEDSIREDNEQDENGWSFSSWISSSWKTKLLSCALGCVVLAIAIWLLCLFVKMIASCLSDRKRKKVD